MSTAFAAAESTAALEAVGISKHFDGVFALDDARFSVRPGEIHALLGENGAGKSTLVKVLTGVHAPDGGRIMRAGEPIELANVRVANRAGIVALYQELSIIPSISVAENILLGERLPSRGGIVQWSALRRRAKEQLDRLNQRIPLRQLAGELSPVQQTMVSFARALANDARILILDEPTASLTDTEITELFAVLRSLRDDGVAIVYVSHRLEEVFELCDRLTIMRNGETVLTKDVADSTIDEVISTMVGRSPGDLFPERGTATSEVALRVSGLSGRRVQDVSFTAHRGEVLGIGGLAGSGRSELLRILAGAQKHKTGTIAVGDTQLPHSAGVAKTLDAGIALVPEERRSQGVILSASIQDNVALANIGAVSSLGMVNGGRIADITRRGMSDLQVKARSPHQPVGELSGGNQQKVVLAKMLARNPAVLLMDEPTRGIDVGTKAEIYRLIRRLAAQGTTVIAVSSELPELIGMSDRVLIMHEGHIAGEARSEDATEELLLAHCYGKTV
ncbi:sugar ABC transporter ATP-binding protein [Modestobacter roseus]|uniref:Ribose transport system ATP-binding protein/rhamnose transport system ATP-binding protein n=1 Tax=Modestobacter roseus TaxID=1181884 RepID=A0A562IMU9_9ACTN|nr:sugar ABC transporter ATP-binding protein [Modestobacter roseus]MQA32521.1 ATP-binding cassette domain-containing protein [Modestobacter roseus]TWH72212.1 ribose transport system ATP-binding protein/rhamnose transport system ATP-binding protein [Modestobacter roseus]